MFVMQRVWRLCKTILSVQYVKSIPRYLKYISLHWRTHVSIPLSQTGIVKFTDMKLSNLLTWNTTFNGAHCTTI
jgi:hypothetical protein